jgi:trehalose-phosphatase
VDESSPDFLIPLITAHHAGEKLVLLFEYDGTLTPIAEYPWLAKLAPQTRELLQQLADLPHVQVGIFTGRRLAEIEQLVDIPGLFYCGHSGIEVKLDGATIVHPAAARSVQLIDEVVRRLASIEHVYPGAWVEKKCYGFTVHFRGVDPSLIAEVHARILGFLERWSDQLRAVDWPLAVEVMVAHAWNKGDAVRRILDHVGEPAFVLYAGDSGSDPSPFDAATTRGGITVGIGPRPPGSAAVHIDHPDTLVHYLDSLLHALQAVPVEM